MACGASTCRKLSSQRGVSGEIPGTVGLILVAMPALAADGFTQQDREMLIELKVRLDQFEKRVDERFEQIDRRFEQIDKRFEQVNDRFGDVNDRFGDVNNRFDDMFNFIYILIGIFTTVSLANIGFAYWDRRTIIRQARREAVEFVEREGLPRRLLDTLRTRGSGGCPASRGHAPL